MSLLNKSLEPLWQPVLPQSRGSVDRRGRTMGTERDSIPESMESLSESHRTVSSHKTNQSHRSLNSLPGYPAGGSGSPPPPARASDEGIDDAAYCTQKQLRALHKLLLEEQKCRSESEAVLSRQFLTAMQRIDSIDSTVGGFLETIQRIDKIEATVAFLQSAKPISSRSESGSAPQRPGSQALESTEVNKVLKQQIMKEVSEEQVRMLRHSFNQSQVEVMAHVDAAMSKAKRQISEEMDQKMRSLLDVEMTNARTRLKLENSEQLCTLLKAAKATAEPPPKSEGVKVTDEHTYSLVSELKEQIRILMVQVENQQTAWTQSEVQIAELQKTIDLTMMKTKTELESQILMKRAEAEEADLQMQQQQHQMRDLNEQVGQLRAQVERQQSAATLAELRMWELHRSSESALSKEKEALSKQELALDELEVHVQQRKSENQEFEVQQVLDVRNLKEQVGILRLDLENHQLAAAKFEDSTRERTNLAAERDEHVLARLENQLMCQLMTMEERLSQKDQQAMTQLCELERTVDVTAQNRERDQETVTQLRSEVRLELSEMMSEFKNNAEQVAHRRGDDSDARAQIIELWKALEETSHTDKLARTTLETQLMCELEVRDEQAANKHRLQISKLEATLEQSADSQELLSRLEIRLMTELDKSAEMVSSRDKETRALISSFEESMGSQRGMMTRLEAQVMMRSSEGEVMQIQDRQNALEIQEELGHLRDSQDHLRRELASELQKLAEWNDTKVVESTLATRQLDERLSSLEKAGRVDALELAKRNIGSLPNERVDALELKLDKFVKESQRVAKADDATRAKLMAIARTTELPLPVQPDSYIQRCGSEVLSERCKEDTQELQSEFRSFVKSHDSEVAEREKQLSVLSTRLDTQTLRLQEFIQDVGRQQTVKEESFVVLQKGPQVGSDPLHDTARLKDILSSATESLMNTESRTEESLEAVLQTAQRMPDIIRTEILQERKERAADSEALSERIEKESLEAVLQTAQRMPDIIRTEILQERRERAADCEALSERMEKEVESLSRRLDDCSKAIVTVVDQNLDFGFVDVKNKLRDLSDFKLSDSIGMIENGMNEQDSTNTTDTSSNIVNDPMGASQSKVSVLSDPTIDSLRDENERLRKMVESLASGLEIITTRDKRATPRNSTSSTSVSPTRHVHQSPPQLSRMISIEQRRSPTPTLVSAQQAQVAVPRNSTGLAPPAVQHRVGVGSVAVVERLGTVTPPPGPPAVLSSSNKPKPATPMIQTREINPVSPVLQSRETRGPAGLRTNRPIRGATTSHQSNHRRH